MNLSLTVFKNIKTFTYQLIFLHPEQMPSSLNVLLIDQTQKLE